MRSTRVTGRLRAHSPFNFLFLFLSLLSVADATLGLYQRLNAIQNPPPEELAHLDDVNLAKIMRKLKTAEAELTKTTKSRCELHQTPRFYQKTDFRRDLKVQIACFETLRSAEEELENFYASIEDPSAAGYHRRRKTLVSANIVKVLGYLKARLDKVHAGSFANHDLEIRAHTQHYNDFTESDNPAFNHVLPLHKTMIDYHRWSMDRKNKGLETQLAATVYEKDRTMTELLEGARALSLHEIRDIIAMLQEEKKYRAAGRPAGRLQRFGNRISGNFRNRVHTLPPPYTEYASGGILAPPPRYSEVASGGTHAPPPQAQPPTYSEATREGSHRLVILNRPPSLQ